MAICNTGSNADITVLDQKTIKKKYPEARIIYLMMILIPLTFSKLS